MGYFVAKTPAGFPFRKRVWGSEYSALKERWEAKGYTVGPFTPGEPQFRSSLNALDAV
jgi:hypothetical protein